ADFVGDVGFQIDPIDPSDNGLSQLHEAIFVAAAPPTAVLRPAKCGHHRTGLILQQSLVIGSFYQEIEAQLEHAGASLGRLLNLDLEHLVPRAPDDHADIFSGRRTHRITLTERHLTKRSRAGNRTLPAAFRQPLPQLGISSTRLRWQASSYSASKF